MKTRKDDRLRFLPVHGWNVWVQPVVQYVVRWSEEHHPIELRRLWREIQVPHLLESCETEYNQLTMSMNNEERRFTQKQTEKQIM